MQRLFESRRLERVEGERGWRQLPLIHPINLNGLLMHNIIKGYKIRLVFGKEKKYGYKKNLHLKNCKLLEVVWNKLKIFSYGCKENNLHKKYYLNCQLLEVVNNKLNC